MAAKKAAAAKTGNKTPGFAVSPRSGAVIPTGAHPKNTGGKKGRSGRPPNAFKDFLADLRSDPAALEKLRAAAMDPTCRAFGAAWKLAAEYDDDKPAEKKQIVGPVDVRVRIVREGRRVTAS